jgi:glycosyltransferase involved in cell wall biosynthesis
VKRVLFIAYHFPPILGSSGYLRTLKFTRYLPEHGIEPTVLTVNPRAYPEWNGAQLAQIPKGVEVVRCFALDAARHLAWRGRYPAFLGVPDRFATWIPFAIAAGLRIIKRKRIDAIISTYPIPSAHVIGGAVARLSGLPWVADFRDPMYDDPPVNLSAPMRARRAIERRAMARCTRALVVTESVRELFRSRYGEVTAAKIQVIPNGYDENDFQGVGDAPREAGAPVTFIHAGLLQQEDRDPVPFFRGIRRALDEGRLKAGALQVKLMGTGNNDVFAREIAALRLEDTVRLLPQKPYSQALREMAAADVLLLFQGPSCDPQIPAKLYEYLRIGKPILAVTTDRGETGRAVRDAQAGRVVAWDDTASLAAVTAEWVARVEAGEALPTCARSAATAYSRQRQAGELAGLLAALPGRS